MLHEAEEVAVWVLYEELILFILVIALGIPCGAERSVGHDILDKDTLVDRMDGGDFDLKIHATAEWHL